MMIDTRKITKKIVEKIEEEQDDLLDKLNSLEEQKVEEYYVKEKELRTFDSLLEYYKNLKSTIHQMNFYKFVLFILEDEETTNNFFQELKNLSILNSTGLSKYAEEQENYSKQIIDNFLYKLEQKENINKENVISKEIKKIENKLDLIRDYKSFFAPIGIVKEIDNANKYKKFLNTLSLSEQDKTKSLLMALDFNVAYHEEKLKDYELENKNIEVLEENTNLKDTIDFNRLAEANKTLKENKNEDAYGLFIKYYEILLGNKENSFEYEVLKKAQEFLKKNKKSIDNLPEITKQDLKDTMNIYLKDEDLREEIYKTTSNIERLLTYEINSIFNSVDRDDQENNLVLIKKLTPVVSYIDNHLVKKK